MQFSIYPWDLKTWRGAFSVSGLPGGALFLLLLGAMLQVEDLSGGGAGHSSSTAILLIRTPAIVLAFTLLLFRPRIAAMRSETQARSIWELAIIFRSRRRSTSQNSIRARIAATLNLCLESITAIRGAGLRYCDSVRGEAQVGHGFGTPHIILGVSIQAQI